MKKLSILTTPAVMLGVGVLCAPQALAASYTLSQTNIEAAAGAAGIKQNGIFCDSNGGYDPFCSLDPGDWTQDGNINLTTVQVGGNPINGLVINNNVNITNSGDSTITGNIDISGAEVTLKDLNVNGSVNVRDANAEVTIDGGSYTNEDAGGALNVDNAKSVEIKDADFKAGGANGASAAYIGAGEITVTNGSFTSEGDNGIEFYGLNSLKISGGTFTGAASGIAFDGAPDAGKVTLTGGTFTGTGANGKAINIYGTDDATVITGMVATGYHFTNSTVGTETGSPDSAYIAGTTKVLADGQTEGEESQATDPTSTSTSTTTKKSGINAPDTGAFTAEEGSATNSSALSLLATVTLATLGAVLIKKHSKRA
ncbi:hypothetical protein IKG24_01640 [Candidatus Saccharibacteria bacterium]|nr:hypothetical protein [Candidatus Saccharibacteria bacterium]